MDISSIMLKSISSLRTDESYLRLTEIFYLCLDFRLCYDSRV
ncbi:hypothetical protein AO385_1613 [Moraxella catarrhalis]|uniref:Uncharacterized protein n=1 Tax=Moraxella catarrhalis TaxID=480 RepID=A0A198UFK4_MORCA|nr:hypothetical protein AO384_1397 [Moraxella catarrhalis]OAU98413.1 hypothetical protein AO385_1613 [Moraxella catarrhalis]OAU99782.1 hypothetical protein AO383_0005 [Moraxella catarrhalis]OAV01730.1 hypothetical protein AO382_0096 [Moraxella catarrhalis]